MENLNLYQKLAKIRALADVVVKEKSGYNYKYADLPSILAKITAGMKKYEVSLIPSIVPGTSQIVQNVIKNTKVSKGGQPYEQTTTEMLFSSQVIFTWVNDANPEERIEVPWFITGSQSDPSMGFGASWSFCTRYFLTNYFQIALVDVDVDDYRSKQREAEAAEAKAVTEGILKTVDDMIQDFVKCSGNEEEARKAVLQLTSKYVKGGNYKKIDNANLAAKLLQEFKDTFLENKEE